MNRLFIIIVIIVLIFAGIKVQSYGDEIEEPNTPSGQQEEQLQPYTNSSGETLEIPLIEGGSSSNDESYFTDERHFGGAHVQCVSERGNIDHYYHFFFSCLVPIVIYQREHPLQNLVLCGSPIGTQMASILKSVFPDIAIVRKCKPSKKRLIAFDGNDGTDVAFITETEREHVVSHFSSLVQASPKDRFKVLLIGRLSLGQRKSSNRAETSGAQRRSIKNFDMLERILQEHFGESLITVYLEEHSILEQFSFFRNAEIIIAQHGAALANTFFVDSNFTRGIIEISPYTKNFHDGKFTHALPDCFKAIAKLVHVPYVRIFQKGEFSDVDELRVLKHVGDLVS